MTARTTSAALSAALALSACSLVGGHKEPPRQFAPLARVAPDAAWPRVDAQLVLAPVQVAPPYDSLRISVRPTPQELQVYKDGTWAQRPAEMLTASLLHTFEAAGRLRAVARAGSGVVGDYRLLLDVRRFESDYAGGATPRATIEIGATLVGAKDTDVLGSQRFLIAEPATGTAVPDVVEAFDRAISRADRDIAGWALSTMATRRR